MPIVKDPVAAKDRKMAEVFANNSLRTVWKKAKKSELSLMKGDELWSGEYKKLSKAFDGGLGPRLDKWEAEAKKFPKHDAKKLGKLQAGVEKIIEGYRAKALEIGVPGASLNGIIVFLDEIRAEMRKRMAFYAKVGG